MTEALETRVIAAGALSAVGPFDTSRPGADHAPPPPGSRETLPEGSSPKGALHANGAGERR